MHTTIRKVTHKNYEEEPDLNHEYENIDIIRKCECGRIMEKTLRHEEIYGHWIPIEEWECPVHG